MGDLPITKIMSHTKAARSLFMLNVGLLFHKKQKAHSSQNKGQCGDEQKYW